VSTDPRWTPETEELVAQIKNAHRTTTTDLGNSGGERYVWRCSCKSGRDRSAPVRWGVARDEMHAHEDRALLAALADAGVLVMPRGETRVEDSHSHHSDGTHCWTPEDHEAVLVRRRVTEWPDGTVMTTPWVEVTERNET